MIFLFGFTGTANAQTNNPIVVENQQLGTPSWRITQPANDLSKQIKGYSSATSVNIGESIDFHVSVSSAQTYQIDIYRMGYYAGQGGRLMSTVSSLNGTPQAYPGPDALTGLIEYDWAVGHTLAVPTNWTSGVYMAKLTNAAGYENYIPFVVRDDNRDADLLYQQAVTTDLAYNNFPNISIPDLSDPSQIGKSTYNYHSRGANTITGNTRAVKVSFDRPNPNDGAGLFFRWEYYQVRWMERMGYDVVYSTNVDTHANGVNLLNYRGFISPGHDEYWSKEMYDSAEVARDSGVNLAFFGGNAVYWQVRFEPSSSGAADRIMVSYKDFLLDPETDTSLETVRFRDAGRAEQQLIGVQYVTYNGSSSNNTAFLPQNLTHWAYDNSGFVAGDSVPGTIGYEVDLYDPNYPLPPNQSYTLLSASPFISQYGNSVTSNASIYQSPSNAWVFGSGTMSWSWALDKFGIVDPRIQQMTVNILDRFVTGEAPIVTVPTDQITLEQETVSFNIVATDSSLDTLVYSAVGLPPQLSINSGTGEIFGTVDDGSSASYNVTVEVSDGTYTVPVSFIWTVLSTNQPPTIASPNAQVNVELDVVSLQVIAADADDEALLYTASDLPTGLTIDAATGEINGTISTGTVGTYISIVNASDGIATASTSFVWTVNALVNEEPLLTIPADQVNDEGTLIALAISAVDPDNDPLTYGATGLPDTLTINPATGLIAGTLSMASSGSYNITIRVTDTVQSVSGVFIWDVNNVNQVPTVVNPGVQSNNEGDNISLQINANDPDGDAIGLSAIGLPPGLSVDGFSGTIVGVLSPTSVGNYSVRLEVSDDSDIVSTFFLWRVAAVNEAPIIDAFGRQVNDAGESVALQTIATDGDGDPLTYSAIGLPPGLSIDQNTGLISGTIPPTVSDSVYNVDVTVADAALTATTTVVWSVNNVNNAPILTPPVDQTSAEGETISLALLAADPDEDVIVFAATGLPSDLTVDSATGEITGVLPFDSAAIYTVTVDVTDGQFADAATFFWTIVDTNQPPTLVNPGAQANNEADVISVAISAADADGDLILYSATGLPAALVMNASTGLITGTVGPLAAGNYVITVGADDGVDVTTDTFNWTIGSTNQPPLLLNIIDRVRTEGDVVSVPISASDPDGDTLTFAASGLPLGLNINSNTGEIYGNIAANSGGAYAVTIIASDGALTATDTFTWTIIDTTQPNQPPVVTMPADRSNEEGTTVSLQIIATDAENDLLTYTPIGLPAGLTLNANNGLISGVLATGSAGTYPIGIEVNDGSDSTTISFIWTVIPPDVGNTCGNLVQEAENGTLSAGPGEFVIGSDAAASGGTYIHAIEGSGNVWAGPDDTRKVDYCFTVTEAGMYRIKANVYGGDTLSDSFYLQVDGAPAGGYLWDTLLNVDYAVDFASDRSVADPVELTLAVGEHIVSIFVREDGTRLDTIELERIDVGPPVGLICAGLTQEAEMGVLSNDFAIELDASASGGEYIHVPEGVGNVWNGANETQKVDYCFIVTAPGSYLIQGVVLGADELSDSFYLKVDDAPANGYLWDATPSTSYTADFVNDRGIADPVEVILDAGNHVVTVYLREDATRLDKISLVPIDVGPPPTPDCAGLMQEAEDGLLTGNFEIAADAAASGGQYVHAPDGTGHFWEGPVAGHTAEYCFVVPASGDYQIQAAVYGADTLSDSFYVKINSAPLSGYLWDIVPNTIYATDFVSDRNSFDPVPVTLSAGNHYMTLFVREDGTRLDTIELVPVAVGAGIMQGEADGEEESAQIAQGISGFVSARDLQLSAEIDFSRIYVTLADAETGGQRYFARTTADRIGRYDFDSMDVGDYILHLELSDEYTTATSTVRIQTTANAVNEVSFDIVQSSSESQAADGDSVYLPMIMLK